MRRLLPPAIALLVLTSLAIARVDQAAPGLIAAAGSRLPALGANVTLAEADCTAAKLGGPIAPNEIGEAVAGVTLAPPAWVGEAGGTPPSCRIDGVMAPVDTSATAKPINFRVVLPASWNHRGAQIGGGGFNGVIPNLTGAEFRSGFATYGSDSGHQSSFGPRGGGGQAAAGPSTNDWALNDESMKNLGHMQMKKTRDAAMILIARAYGERPRFNYYVGTSQGGREALTVIQRYPADYDGIIANVPVVSFSSLTLGPHLIRIKEKPLANWVTLAKVNAIRGEFMRQCDALDGLADGVMNNYMACRAIFDVRQGAPNRRPWATKRCPNNVDPDPADTTAAACLTDGHIATLEFVYQRYAFTTPLANGTRSFGMWVPTTDPSGSGLMTGTRFRGQEGAGPDAPMHSHLGVLGVTGYLMRDLSANPLDYVEGGPFNARRVEISSYLDATATDLSAFYTRGGKMIVTIGTNDTLASPGAQLDYFQSVIDRMGQATVDQFARFFVIPQAGHGLSGTNAAVNGDGQTIPTGPIPNTFDRLAVLSDWVERNVAPGKSLVVTAGTRRLPLCSYPAFPRYTQGEPFVAASYTCSMNK
jgi:Tannase and feruloyl esterase